MPSHDVLVIGAGLAGERAALAAAAEGASVGILSKVHPVRSHSNAAQGGINAALNPEDTWESHAFDTVKGSDYLGDQDAIEIMCREAPNELLHLEHIGVTFHRYEEWFTTSLVLDDDGACTGVVARDIRTGAMETFHAKNVILASGGAGQCFKPTTNALICTGDGIAQAYRVGAPLMDMEMI